MYVDREARQRDPGDADVGDGQGEVVALGGDRPSASTSNVLWKNDDLHLDRRPDREPAAFSVTVSP